jgi:hypothetical protein
MITLAIVLSTTAALQALAPGTYRLDVEVVVVASVPVLGEQRTTTTTTSIVDVDDSGVATAAACRVETKGPGFRSRMPPSSLRGLPISRFTITKKGNTISADMGAGTVGFLGSGPLPQRADDPRVIDPDGDGKPGILLDLDLGTLGQYPIQVVSQGQTAFEGTLTATGAIGRLTLVRSTEQVLSGLPVKLPARSDAIDPKFSRFSMERLEGPDRSMCAW